MIPESAGYHGDGSYSDALLLAAVSNTPVIGYSKPHNNTPQRSISIPEVALEAAEAVLLGYTGGCACHEGYSGRNLIDPECSYHDVPPEVARLILEAAAPHMLADCWDASAKATADYELEYRVNFDFGDDLPEPPTNPYRPTP